MNSLQDGAAPAPWSAPVENPLPGFSRLPGAAGDVDWGATPLGLPAAWPDELRAAAGICLSSQFPLAIVWGPEFVYVYNDAAISVFGTKHPWAMGRRVIDVWPDAWPTLGPMLESVLRTGQAVRNDDLELMIDPHGQLVEAYLTFSYSPIVSARGTIGGVFIAFMETTERVLAERRQRTVSDLATAVARGRRSDDLLTRVREALDDHRRDLPFTRSCRRQPPRSWPAWPRRPSRAASRCCWTPRARSRRWTSVVRGRKRRARCWRCPSGQAARMRPAACCWSA